MCGVEDGGSRLAFALLPKPYWRKDLARAVRAALGERVTDG